MGGDHKVSVTVGRKKDVPAETVDHHADQAVFKTDLYRFLLSVELA